MNEYRERVEVLARLRNGEPIYNGSLEHAAIIIEKMFSHAKKHACILTGDLYAPVYGREKIVNSAWQFLSVSSRTLKILVEDEGPITWAHPFLEKFKDNRNIEVRRMPSNLPVAFHFFVMDSDSYRFESDKKNPSAIAAFGDKKGVAANMEVAFDSYWKAAKPVAALALVAA